MVGWGNLLKDGLALIDLCPEAVLQDLFGVLQALVICEAIQVGQDAHDFWESMRLHAARQSQHSEVSINVQSTALEDASKCIS